MPKWITRLPKEFRTELHSFGKNYEGIEKACGFMIKTLAELKKKIPAKIQKQFADPNFIEDDETDRWNKLHYLIEETSEHFDFCRNFANGTITKTEWQDYDFDGDLIGMFNDYMSEFWNICDTIMNDKNRYDYDVQKFCWVEL